MTVERTLLITSATLFLLSAQANAASQKKERPNFIVILADDLGYADVGFNGCRDIPTPHIDSLARDGVRCTNAYVTPDDPPAFLCVGEKDKKFRVGQMTRLAATCKEVGLDHRFVIQPGMPHQYIDDPKVIGEIFSFFDRYLKP